MDVGESLKFVFDDERWITKLLIGLVLVLLSIFIIPIFLLIGYMIAVTRNVKDGVKKPLPEWEDWGKLFMDGVYVFIAQFVYTLPLLLIVCIATIATGGLGAIADSGGNPDAIVAVMGTTMFVIGCLAFIWMIALIFISPAIVIQYILNNDELGACFRFGEVFGIARDSIADILIVILVTIGVSIAISLIGMIPCLGWIVALFASPYLTAVTGHLYGQIATRYVGGKEKFA